MKEVMKKLTEHDRRFDEHDKHFENLEDRMDLLAIEVSNHGDRLDKITTELLKHGDRLDKIETNMVTKKDHERVMNTLDRVLVIVQRVDQEITMIAHGAQRTNHRVDHLEKFEKHVIKMNPVFKLK